MPPIYIRSAHTAEEKMLRGGIEEFQLDDAGFSIEQFLIAEAENEIAGFCRVRVHESCLEFCTMGVYEKFRNKGVAKALSEKVMDIAKLTPSKNLYLVCIIPGFFVPLGFKIVTDYPKEMTEKLQRCETHLAVPEKYVVMVKER